MLIWLPEFCCSAPTSVHSLLELGWFKTTSANEPVIEQLPDVCCLVSSLAQAFAFTYDDGVHGSVEWNGIDREIERSVDIRTISNNQRTNINAQRRTRRKSEEPEDGKIAAKRENLDIQRSNDNSTIASVSRNKFT